MKASIVVGLGFGDEGKGITTDYLCSQSSETPIVIRFSGGQQAGHTVMLGDKKHVHSNYGSGTLRGAKSYFTEHCCIYPNTMMEERRVLLEKGVTPELIVHPFAKLTTPYDVAFNRVMERRLGHGSCGLGIAATMKRHNDTGYKTYAMDFEAHRVLYAKMDRIRDYYLMLLKNFVKTSGPLAKMANDAMIKDFNSEVEKQMPDFDKAVRNWQLFETRDYKFLRGFKNLIFEGSQGIMLDMDFGIFPNVTYGNVTSKNALEVMNKVFGGYTREQLEIYYITRCYLTRHGTGWTPFGAGTPTLINNEEEINCYNQWQTHFKVQEIDYPMLNYALYIDSQYVDSRVKKNLVVTCMDQRPGFKFEYGRINQEFSKKIESHSPYSKDMRIV